MVGKFTAITNCLEKIDSAELIGLAADLEEKLKNTAETETTRESNGPYQAGEMTDEHVF